MYDALLISIEVLLIQLSDSYLRYLPFANLLNPAVKRHLLQRSLMWILPGLTLYTCLLQYTGIYILSYKFLYAIGWLPFVCISIFTTKQRILHHIFILGMQTIYFFLLHAISNNIILFLPPLSSLTRHIELQAALYLLSSALLLPLMRRVFSNLLPSRHLINDRSYGYYIAFLPFFIGLSYISISLDNEFHTVEALNNRFILFICFVIIARYVALEKVEGEQQRATERRSELLTHQLYSLQDYMSLVKDNQTRFKVLRHDMRHLTRILYSLIAAKENDEALSLLNQLDEHLEQTANHPIAANPILNAALSIYFKRAQNLGITTDHNVALPKKLTMDETDLAILLANLLENAIIATQKMPGNTRKICLRLRSKGSQIVLMIENSCTQPLNIGPDGLPHTQTAGHGTGMISLSLFAKKYQATVNFTQENGLVRLLMYWHLPQTACSQKPSC